MRTSGFFLSLLLFAVAIGKKVKAETDSIMDLFPKLPSYEIVRELIPILEKGSVVIIQREAGKPPFVTGIVLINAQANEVLRLIRDYERYPEFVPNVIKLRVLERYPESNTQISEYNIGFNVAFGIKFIVTYTVEQIFFENEKIIIGLPAKKGTQVFTDVRYIEKYYETEDGRTIMVYSSFVDLSSFGTLSRLVYRAFPELQVPSLVAVSTLFPEVVKEKMEEKKIITEPKKVDHDNLKIPDRIDLNVLFPLLKTYGTVVVSWYPDKDDVRFFSSYVFLPKRNIEEVRHLVTDFKSWPRIFKIVERAEAVPISGGYKVRLKLKYKIALPIEVEYTTICKWDKARYRLTCAIDETEKRDIEGVVYAWDFYEAKQGVVLGYTEFSDLRTGNFFLRILMDKVRGFGIGLRVALVSALTEFVKKNI